MMCHVVTACPLCTRLGLQSHLNTTLMILKDAQQDADTVSNLKQLWPELINVEGLITEAQVSLSSPLQNVYIWVIDQDCSLKMRDIGQVIIFFESRNTQKSIRPISHRLDRTSLYNK